MCKDPGKTKKTQSTLERYRTSHIPRWQYYGVGKDFIGILHIFKWDFVTTVRILDEALDHIVRLYAAVVGAAIVLMNDNARPHKGVIIDDCLKSEE